MYRGDVECIFEGKRGRNVQDYPAETITSAHADTFLFLQFEAQGHETLAHHKARVNDAPGHTDKEILTEEGAAIPSDTTAGGVKLQGAH